MKNLLIITITFLFNINFLYAQDQVLGKYLTPKKTGKIEIIKHDNKYFGKIIQMQRKLIDVKNPDESLRNRPILGSEFMKSFTYNGKDTWENGTIYDAESGKTYNCILTLDKDNNLSVRGFIGISLFGKTASFERIKE